MEKSLDRRKKKKKKRKDKIVREWSKSSVGGEGEILARSSPNYARGNDIFGCVPVPTEKKREVNVLDRLARHLLVTATRKPANDTRLFALHFCHVQNVFPILSFLPFFLSFLLLKVKKNEFPSGRCL